MPTQPSPTNGRLTPARPAAGSSRRSRNNAPSPRTQSRTTSVSALRERGIDQIAAVRVGDDQHVDTFERGRLDLLFEIGIG
jgi:hypothetical protein